MNVNVALFAGMGKNNKSCKRHVNREALKNA
jgi:hypothetical protein